VLLENTEMRRIIIKYVMGRIINRMSSSLTIVSYKNLPLLLEIFHHSQNFFSDAKKIPLDKVTKQFFSWHKIIFSCSKKNVLVARKNLAGRKKLFCHFIR